MNKAQQMIDTYGKTYLSKNIVFKYNNTSNTLLVVFAGKLKQFICTSWFYNCDKYTVLFLKDDDENTYQHDDFYNIINDAKSDKKNVIFFGVSMGSVAAIKIGYQLNPDLIICVDPEPINYNLDDFFTKDKIKKIQNIHLFCSNSKDDKQRLEKYLPDYIKITNSFTVEYKSTVGHISFIPTKEYIDVLIKYYLEKNNIQHLSSWELKSQNNVPTFL